MLGDRAIATLSADEIQALADRLYGRGINSAAMSAREQSDLILASRVLRILLRRYEHAVGRTLRTIMIGGDR
jgi:type IV secretory pathway ATPase VirB11/archaellum biosynthesis ATPase